MPDINGMIYPLSPILSREARTISIDSAMIRRNPSTTKEFVIVTAIERWTTLPTFCVATRDNAEMHDLTCQELGVIVYPKDLYYLSQIEELPYFIEPDENVFCRMFTPDRKIMNPNEMGNIVIGLCWPNRNILSWLVWYNNTFFLWPVHKLLRSSANNRGFPFQIPQELPDLKPRFEIGNLTVTGLREGKTVIEENEINQNNFLRFLGTNNIETKKTVRI